MIVSDTLIVAVFVWLIAREFKAKDRVTIQVGHWRVRAENTTRPPSQARKKTSAKPALKNQKSKQRRKKKPPP